MAAAVGAPVRVPDPALDRWCDAIVFGVFLAGRGRIEVRHVELTGGS